MDEQVATYRFYEELNDFLPRDRRKKDFDYAFSGRPSVKDVVESLGVPHTEIDLILVNGESVDFAYHMVGGDRVSVYPVFESLDIAPLVHLRPQPLREPRFILDVHLGKLAKHLRMLGFDCLYKTDYSDHDIARIASVEKRIVLTRDVGLLKMKQVERGYWVRSPRPFDQTREVIDRLDLATKIDPFKRCRECNGEISSVKKEKVLGRIHAKTARFYDIFYECRDCKRVYWEGSHFPKLKELVKEFVKDKQ